MVWIIGNGAPKTGSTWVAELLNNLPGVHPVPERFVNKWAWPSVQDEMAEQAASELGPSHVLYFSKQHWTKETWLLGVPGIRVINSIRDIRDTLVSRYNHDIRLSQVPQMTISEYLPLHGQSLVAAFCNYHDRWLSAPDLTRDNYHVVSYEGLTADLTGAAASLANFCGLAATPESIAPIAEKTRFDKHKVRGEGEFFRKGQAGSFLEDLTEAEADQILVWANERGLTYIKRKLAEFAPSIAPYLAQTDVGLGVVSEGDHVPFGGDLVVSERDLVSEIGEGTVSAANDVARSVLERRIAG